MLAVDDGPLRQVDRLAPFGVPAADELPGLIRIEASLPSTLANAAGEVVVDLVALGPGGLEIRGAGDPLLIEHQPPASFTGGEGLVLTRLAGKPWEEGYNVFSSEPIVVLADLRASHYYPLSDQEKARSENDGMLCSRCDLVAEGVYSASPTELYREILSGHQLGVRLPALLRTGLAELYDGLMLEQAEIEVASVPWDTSPALRQEPTLNPWYDTGDVAPGTLLHSGEMSLEVRVTPGPAGANGSSEELVTTFEYETETNQPERIVDPLGAVTVIKRNGVGLAERMTRAAGADEAGTTEYSYDQEKTVRVERFDGTDQLLAREDTVYDWLARVVERREWLFDEEPLATRELIWTTTYDAVARLERLMLPGFPEGAVYLYEYDKAHNPEMITDPNGTIVDQEFDGANRLMTRTVTLGSNVEGVTAESFGYDGLNRLTSLTSGSVTTNLQWDSLSRLLSEETLGKTVGYEYDDAGSLGELSYPSGLVVARGHDNLNRPREIGPWVTGEGGEPEIDAQVAYDYRGPSLVHEKILGNGLGGLRQYDQARRPVNIEMDAGPTREVYQESLSWSPRGLKVATTRGDDNGRGWLLGHDGAERLLHAVDEDDATSTVGNNQLPDLGQLAGKPERSSFTYDPLNNLTSREFVDDGETQQLVDLTPDASGRNRPGQMGDVELKYDNNGNLIEKGDFRFYYDFRNRLTRVTDSISGTEVEVASYVYDGFNRRIGKTVAGGPAEGTVWSGWRELEEYRDGTFFSRHTFGLGLDEIVKMEIDSDLDGTTDTELYPVYDSTGNLIVLTDEQTWVVAKYTYAPFGRDLKSSVDPDPPVIHQAAIEGGTIWIESSEELLWNNLEEGLSSGDIELSVTVPPLSAPGTATSKAALRKTLIPITVHQPIQDGRQARRRVIVTATDPPLPGTEVRLTLRPPAVRDLFLNELSAAFQQTFPWPEEGAARIILVDETPPAVDEVVLRDGHLEVTLSEEPDMALVGSALLVDGGAIGWTLKEDTYTVRSDAPLAAGEHTLRIDGGAPFDLAGKGLEEPFETQVSVEEGTANTEIYSRPDPRIVDLESLVNRFTFHGRPVDVETGLYYFRNRHFDPELGRFITADPLGYVDGPSMYQFARYGPFDYTDPLGLACVTQNGGVNWLCDPMNEMELSSESSALQWTWAVGTESLGNSATDLLFLNIIADAPHGALDPDRTPGERAWSATKGAGITAFNVAGGAVLGKGANLLLRTPAARWFVGRVLGSRPGQKALEILTADVGALARRANPFRIFDDLAGVVDDAIREGATGIDDLVPRIDKVVPSGTSFEEAAQRVFRNKIVRQNEVIRDNTGRVIAEIDFETAEAVVEVGQSLGGKSQQLFKLAEIARSRAKRLDVLYDPATAPPRRLSTLRQQLRGKFGNRVRFIPFTE